MSDIENGVTVEEDIKIEERGIGIFPTVEKEKEFKHWIDNRISAAFSDRSEREEKWKDWRKLRINTPEEGIKKRPYPVSAKMTIPITEINVNGIAGKIRSAMMIDPPWTVKSLKKDDDEAEANAKIINKYLTILAKNPDDLNFRSLQHEIIYEAVSMGTEFVKIPWKHEEKTYRKSASDIEGQENEEFTVVKNGAEIVPIPLEDFVYELEGGIEIDRLTWCAHRFYVTKTELLNLNKNAVYENVDEVLRRGGKNVAPDSISDQEDFLGYSESNHETFELFEIWAYYDIDDTKAPYDLVVTYSREADAVLKADYNSLGMRPFVNVIYGLYPGLIEGRGVCETLSVIGKSINTLNRMRFDNININTTALFATTRGSGISQKEQIYPGKIFKLDNIANFQRVPGGSPYSSTLQEEQMLVQYAQKASGFSDAMGGFADATMKSRDTFSAQSQRLAMGEGQLSAASEGMEMAFGKIGMAVFYQLVSHKTAVIENERALGRMTEADIKDLEKALSMEVEDIPRQLSFTVTTTDPEQSFAAKRQTLLMTSQLVDGYYDKIIQMKMMMLDPMVAQNPEIQEIVMKACIAKTKLTEEVIKLNEIDDTDSYVYNTKVQEQQMRVMDFMKDIMAQEKAEEFEYEKGRLRDAGQAGITDNGVQQGQEVVNGDVGPGQEPAGNIPDQGLEGGPG